MKSISCNLVEIQFPVMVSIRLGGQGNSQYKLANSKEEKQKRKKRTNQITFCGCVEVEMYGTIHFAILGQETRGVEYGLFHSKSGSQ